MYLYPRLVQHLPLSGRKSALAWRMHMTTRTKEANHFNVLKCSCTQADVAKQFGAEVSPDDNVSLDDSWGHWPAFPDSVEALQYLKQHYRLVALTNAGRRIGAFMCPAAARVPASSPTFAAGPSACSYANVAHIPYAGRASALKMTATLHQPFDLILTAQVRL